MSALVLPFASAAALSTHDIHGLLVSACGCLRQTHRPAAPQFTKARTLAAHMRRMTDGARETDPADDEAWLEALLVSLQQEVRGPPPGARTCRSIARAAELHVLRGGQRACRRTASFANSLSCIGARPLL